MNSELVTTATGVGLFIAMIGFVGKQVYDAFFRQKSREELLLDRSLTQALALQEANQKQFEAREEQVKELEAETKFLRQEIDRLRSEVSRLTAEVNRLQSD